MDPPEPQDRESPEAGPELPGSGEDWLEEIIDRLEQAPEECWPALEGLSALDEEIGVRVIAALADHRDRPAVRDLLRLMGATRRPAVRSAPAVALTPGAAPASPDSHDGDGRAAGLPAVQTDAPTRHDVPDRRVLRIARSLVTAIDGDGRGTIVLSLADRGFRRTAAFRCDVVQGILDVVGEVEEDRPTAGRMIEEWIEPSDGNHALDVHELAVRLLEGCLRLAGPQVPDQVRAWLHGTIGPVSFLDRPVPTLPVPLPTIIPDGDLIVWSDRILDACPAWLDRSALTLELAEEITLREGDAMPDPIRDAGAYRYLFEHLLIGRLELYARMLLWMAWVWQAGGRPDLAQPAFVLAAQLSDEQYAVPSHPFTVTLATRSLRAAQEVLLDGDDRGAAY